MEALVAAKTIASPTVKRQGIARRLALHWQLYVFLLIPVVYILLFAYYPMLGVQIAFRKFSPATGVWGSPWVGIDQFTKFFESYMFSRVVVNTISVSLYGMIAGFPMPIILALLLNSMPWQKYKKTVQTITYLPYFISTVVLVGIVKQLLNTRIGMIPKFYTLITGNTMSDFFASPAPFMHLYVWSGIWQGTGWGSIIYLAALAGVDVSLHEAAAIDGATRFQRVLHVDFPSILPTITIQFILRMGSIMSVGFEKVFLLQTDLNKASSEVISTYVYQVGLSKPGGDFSYAAAIGLFNSFINFFLVVVVNAITRKVSETSLW